jgi:ABC-type multidrug transport system ATPase subunit
MPSTTKRTRGTSDMVAHEEPKPPVPAIEVKNLTVSYGPAPALLDVSFAVPAGKLVGVIGPNGSGKSTLIKAILGFLKPDFGEVRLFGQPPMKRSAASPMCRSAAASIGIFPSPCRMSC